MILGSIWELSNFHEIWSIFWKIQLTLFHLFLDTQTSPRALDHRKPILFRSSPRQKQVYSIWIVKDLKEIDFSKFVSCFGRGHILAKLAGTGKVTPRALALRVIVWWSGGPLRSPGPPGDPASAEKTFGFEGAEWSFEVGSGSIFSNFEFPGNLAGELACSFWIIFGSILML